MAKGFLICPVRGHAPDETQSIVDKLEAQGWQIHWPFRDTKQDDLTGYNICKSNRNAIEQAEMVFVIWDGKSQGCLFDLGMTFALNKSITIIQIPPITVGKSFQNMIREWQDKAIVPE